MNKINGFNHSEEEISRKEFFFDEKDYFVIEYEDTIPLNGDRKVKIKNLGEKFASINSFFFEYLKEYHIPAAFVKSHNKNSIKVLRHTKFPFAVKILNVADKRTAKIFGMKEGNLLNLPIFEIHTGNGKDSMITESHLIAFDLCSVEHLKLINRICSKVNAVLKSFFERRGYILAEATCHFGKFEEKIFVVDDFTPKSLKIIPLNKEEKPVDPYKFNTSAEIKHYTDHLFNIMSAQ